MTKLDELSRRARVAFVLLEIGFIGLLTIQLIYIVVRGEPWISVGGAFVAAADLFTWFISTSSAKYYLALFREFDVLYRWR
jgi:hypothetical protein